jgi:hypothetical protein
VAGNLVDRDEATLLCVELAYQIAVSIEDFAHDRRVVIIERSKVGKVANQEHVDREGADGDAKGQNPESYDCDPDPPRPEKSHLSS